MASPQQKLLEAIIQLLGPANKRQRSPSGTNTPGTYGKNIYSEQDPSLKNTETLDEVGVPRTLGKGQGDQQLPPRPPPSPMESLDAEINKLAQPSPPPGQLRLPFTNPPQRGDLEAARGIYSSPRTIGRETTTYTPPPAPSATITDRLNVLRNPKDIPDRAPSKLSSQPVGARNKEGDDKILKAVGAKEPFRQTGIPKSNTQLDFDERAGRNTGEISEVQSTTTSGSEQVDAPFRKRATGTDQTQNQILDRIKEFTIEMRQGRKRSPATDRFAIDRRTLLDREGITNRLKARAAGQIRKYDPSIQYDSKAVGPEFDKFNKKMQTDMAAIALVAKRDPQIQAALKEANLGLNERATDSIALDIYYDLYPDKVPPHVARDIEHFRKDKAGVKDIDTEPSPDTKLEDSQAGELEATLNDVRSRTNIGKGPKEPSTEPPDLTVDQIQDALGTSTRRESFPTIPEAAQELGLTVEELLERINPRKYKQKVAPPKQKREILKGPEKFYRGEK